MRLPGRAGYEVRPAPATPYLHQPRSDQAGADLTLEQCAAVLLGPDDEPYGRGAAGPQYGALLRAFEIGSPEATALLGEFLVSDNTADLKRTALCLLGLLGTEDAVAAITAFEKWAASRYTNPRPWGPKVRPLASYRDHEGVRWGIFRAYRFGRPDMFVARARGDGAWELPVLVEISEGGSAWQHSGFGLSLDRDGQFGFTTRTPFRLDQFLRDRDEDGLTDPVERRMGTRSDVPDTDADGVPDGIDSNPLTPKHHIMDDATEVRQAVFSALFATTASDGAIWVAGSEDFARQEYYGYGGPVLHRRRPEPGTTNLIDFQVEITTPTTAGATLTIWTGMLGGTGYAAYSTKVHDKWVVTSFARTWMS